MARHHPLHPPAWFHSTALETSRTCVCQAYPRLCDAGILALQRDISSATDSILNHPVHALISWTSLHEPQPMRLVELAACIGMLTKARIDSRTMNEPNDSLQEPNLIYDSWPPPWNFIDALLSDTSPCQVNMSTGEEPCNQLLLDACCYHLAT